jgi:hypothetical protein
MTKGFRMSRMVELAKQYGVKKRDIKDLQLKARDIKRVPNNVKQVLSLNGVIRKTKDRQTKQDRHLWRAGPHYEHFMNAWN